MTDEVQQKDRRGTIWDWPVGIAVGGAILFFLAAANGGAGGVLLGALMALFGTVTVLARRGTFSPRRR